MAAAVNGASLHTQLGDFPPALILCPVCQKPYKEPKVLPCLHSFCQQCLQDSLAKSNIGPGQAFLCPICRAEAVVPKRGVPAMQNNIFLETVAEFQLKKSGQSKDGVDYGPGIRKCEGCDTRAPASMKCIECDDWLCSRCCNMHNKVKLTREHHLVTAADLASGEYDDVLKGTFDALVCAKHDEPLKLYCTEPSCLTPICTVCKNTLGHDGHRAVELSDQARKDADYIRALNEHAEKSIEQIHQRVNNIRIEEQILIRVRKDIHKEINDRMAYLIDKIVKQITAHAESLHEEVEIMAKKHKEELTIAAEECRYQMRAAKDARQFAKCLTEFGRAEEIVAMSRITTTRLNVFQVIINIEAPPWRQPRLYPAQEFTDEEIARMFGRLTFQGEMVKSVCTSHFTIDAPGDDRPVAISDMSITEDDDIIVCDRDNRRIKVYDLNGDLQFATNIGEFKEPNRVTALKTDGNVLVKDDKSLKILRPDGIIVGQFAFHLNHPVGACQAPGGEILITDWGSGTVHALTESGEELYSFNTSLEAPAFIAATFYGRIVVSDWKNHIVRVYSKQGKVIGQYGGIGEGSLEGQLNHPYGVTTDKYGHIIVADNWNHRITLLEDDGRFIRHLATKEDGLEWPQQVCVDSKGRLIAAELNGKIKIFQYMA